MLSVKAPGRHPRFGTLYFWLLTALFLSATALSTMRWEHAYHLFLLGAFSFLTAFIGRTARRRRTHGTYWAFPIFIGVPIIIWALVRHSVARQGQLIVE